VVCYHEHTLLGPLKKWGQFRGLYMAEKVINPNLHSKKILK
jgi:hypothetical protein